MMLTYGINQLSSIPRWVSNHHVDQGSHEKVPIYAKDVLVVEGQVAALATECFSHRPLRPRGFGVPGCRGLLVVFTGTRMPYQANILDDLQIVARSRLP